MKWLYAALVCMCVFSVIAVVILAEGSPYLLAWKKAVISQYFSEAVVAGEVVAVVTAGGGFWFGAVGMMTVTGGLGNQDSLDSSRILGAICVL